MFKVAVNECLGCGICIDTCQKSAISLEEDCAVIDQSLCEKCGECLEVCAAEAIKKE